MINVKKHQIFKIDRFRSFQPTCKLSGLRGRPRLCHFDPEGSSVRSIFSRKNRERRENVISELVVTEREFCRDLKLTWQAFGLDTPAMLEQRGVDVATLFGNVADVIDVSERFLDTLQVKILLTAKKS